MVSGRELWMRPSSWALRVISSWPAGLREPMPSAPVFATSVPATLVRVPSEDIRFTAVSWTSLAQKVALRWEPRCSIGCRIANTRSSTGGDCRSRSQISRSAGIPVIPRPTLTAAEQDAIGRYLDLAPELADASLFAAAEQFTVSIDDEDGSEAIEATRSARDITVGFLVTWRQFY